MDVGKIYETPSGRYVLVKGVGDRTLLNADCWLEVGDNGGAVGPLKEVGELPRADELDREQTQRYALDRAKEFFAHLNRRENKSVSRFLMLRQRGDHLAPVGATGPCHAKLSRGPGKLLALVTSPAVPVWPTWNGGHGSRGFRADKHEPERFPEDCAMFWQWLMHESPWRNIYLTKPDPEVAYTDGVLLDVYAPGNLTSQAITATRMPHEFPGRVRVWADVVRAGGDPLLALVMAEGTAILVQGAGERVGLSVDQRAGCIHDMFNMDKTGPKQVQAMRKLEVVKSLPPLSETCRFGGVQGVWGETAVRASSFIGLLPRNIRPSKKGEKEYLFNLRSMRMDPIANDEFIEYHSGIRQLAEYSIKLLEAGNA